MSRDQAKQLLTMVVLIFPASAVYAARDYSVNPNSSWVSMLVGIAFWVGLIFIAIKTIFKSPVRGSAKVISYIIPFIIGFGLPIFIPRKIDVPEGSTIFIWLGSWVMAYLYINIHAKIFPEDDKKT